MTGKNYYKTLELAENASSEDIKAAFKKLARKYHPDNKETGNEEKFKEINEAYQHLSDPHAKDKYDYQKKYGSPNTSSKQSSYEDLDFDKWVNDLFREHNFSQAYNNSSSSKYQTYQGKAEKPIDLDINTALNLTFMEAALGCSKTIKFSHRKECHSCEGVGYKGSTGLCKKCNGRKVVSQTQMMGGAALGQMIRCPICSGTGVGYTQECKDCQATGGISELDSLEVKIPAGVNTGSKIRFSGYGNVLHKSKGNLYLNLTVDNNHPRFTRDNLNIYTKEDVKLTDLLLGKTIKVETIHKIVDVSIPAGCQPNSKLRLSGLGIDNHDHFIELNLVLPKKITPKQKDLLEQLDI